MKGFLAVFTILGFLIPSSGQAATINVTSTADSGAGSLRDAIAAASSIHFELCCLIEGLLPYRVLWTIYWE